jgi:hypothetical protein
MNNTTAEIFDLKESVHDGALLKKLFTEYFGGLPFKGEDSFSHIPVVVKPHYLSQMEHLCSVLNKALVKVVSAYFTDERIRAIYNLDIELENILKVAAEKEYRVGLYRPDILQDVNGQAKICEIGARYPINGWMLSYYLTQAVSNPDVIEQRELQAIPGQQDFVDTLYHIFDAREPVVMVHDKEKGTEVFNLLNEFRKKGLDSLSASPVDFELDNGEVKLNGIAVSQFILEMDREELRTFSPDVLHHIIRNGNYFNDVRTLILVHDKRILAVLYDDAIMADYLAADEHQFLKSFLIPTYTLNSLEKREEIIQSKQNWLIKQNSGGRGIGIYVKDECTPESWAVIIEEQWPEYMAQLYIDQQQFTYNLEKVSLVGMLLCYNDHSFGPGIFRASAECIINAHEGRAVILPPMVLRS